MSDAEPGAPLSAAPSPDPRAAMLSVREEVAKVVVGQEGTLSGLVAALLARGHVLLEGVPGVAKTLVVKAFAAALDLDAKRVQFTPDLMPSDVTGQLVLEGVEGGAAGGRFRFRPGPVFTNVLLADEINRTPPKTQAALLESMEERQVSVEGVAHPLPEPFMVVATQNPIEYEGTYPLPEAQLDRFVLRTRLGYLDADHEVEMARRRLRRGAAPPALAQVTDPAELLAMIGSLERIEVHDDLLGYIVALVQATREHPKAQVGASPRGTLAVTQLARGAALLAGRDYVTPEDVQRVAGPALGHRIVLRPELWVRRVTGEDLVAEVVEQVPTPATRPADARVRT